jgi:energy-converting hydrogenase Eha subunit B
MALTAGPLTSILLACATCISAGVVLGGFVAGLADYLMGRLRFDSDARVRLGSYWGGLLAVALALVDLVMR